MLLVLWISFLGWAAPKEPKATVLSLREQAIELFMHFEAQFVRGKDYEKLDQSIQESLESFGQDGAKAYEPYFASLRIPCLLALQKFEEARRLTQSVCRKQSRCVEFYNVVFQMASTETQEVYPTIWLHDVTEILKSWDGTYRPFQSQGFKMVLAGYSLLPFLKPLIGGAVHHGLPDLISILIKSNVLPLLTLIHAWLECLQPHHCSFEGELELVERFKRSIDEVAKKTKFPAESEPAVLLLFLRIQVALLERDFGFASQESRILIPHFKALALERPGAYRPALLRALWGQYFAAAEQGFELEAVQIFLEIKKGWPQSGLLKLRQPYHIYWFGNRAKAYQSFKALLKRPFPDPKESGLRMDFDEETLKKIVLEDFFSLGEWIWAGELIDTYACLEGHVLPSFEAFARLQYRLIQKMEGHPLDKQQLHQDLETLRWDASVPFLPMASIMSLAAHEKYEAAREAFHKSQDLFKRFVKEDNYRLIFVPLFNFFEDAPPSAEKALFEDALRDSFERHVPDFEVDFNVQEEIRLPSSHQRTLEKIFEPMCGLKRLHQVHLKRRQVEGLFEALGCVGGFGRIAKGSHHLVGLKVADQRISTVLSADIVPHYQIRQLQRLFKRAGVLPEKYKDQIQQSAS
jgi:hypothetical protein